MSTLEVGKIVPATGTAITLGESGDTLTVPSGATLAVASGATLANSGTDIAVAITPASSSNKVLIVVSGGIVKLPGNGGFATATIYRNAVNLDADGLSQHGQSYSGLAAGPSGFDFRRPESMFYLDSPSTTSAVTYTVYAKVSAQTMTYGDASIPMTMTAMEVSA